MFCPKCGAQNPDGAKFCKGCGAPLGGRPAAAPHAGAPTPGAAWTPGVPGAAPTPGVPAAAPVPGMPGATSTPAMGPRLKARVPAIVAVVAIAAVLVVGLATSWFGLAANDGLKAGTYYLNNSDGSPATMLSVHGDGIVGVTDPSGWTIEGKSEVTNSNGHLVVKLSDLRGSGLGGADASDLSISLILPSKLGKGSYAGDYALAALTGSGTRGTVEWLQLRDDGSASHKVYVCGMSSSGNSFNDALNAIAYGDSLSDKDPNVILGSIANGNWSDAQADTATWHASDSGGSGFDVYSTSGQKGLSASYEPFK
jgi:hypothetical protein